MEDRTEGAGLAGLLTVTLGGEPVTLRALTIEESDAWLGELAHAMADIDIEDVPEDGTAAMTGLLRRSGTVALRLVQAYDKDGALAGALPRATKREVKAALDTMVTVEDPFGEGVSRSVDVVFGEPGRTLAAGILRTLIPYLSARSLNSLSMSGDESTPGTSDPDGPASNSSSTGPTDSTGSPMRSRTKPT